MPQVVLKPRKARPFFGRHPWVLDSAIDRIDGNPEDGDVVELFTDRGEFIARGIFNGRGRIYVRLYSWNRDEAIDATFWRRRLEAACRLRHDLDYDQPDGAARLVFSEADGLSGLIVDRYANYLVIQITAMAMAVRLPEIVAILNDLLHPEGVHVRTERDIVRAEGLELQDGPYEGKLPEGPIEIVDRGLRYGVDLTEGQKTGFYLDQRENRHAAADYLRGRSVLDMFCYSGGFALAAAAGGASHVLGIDSSQRAVAQAQANATRNSLTNVRFEAGEAFAKLEEMAVGGKRFGGVILDPPKFARSRGGVDDALRAYVRLNRAAVELIEPGGFLVTCSCSGHVHREDFFDMLVSVAQQSRRDLQVLEQRGASPDHPVTVTCPETEYLKCFICRLG